MVPSARPAAASAVKTSARASIAASARVLGAALAALLVACGEEPVPVDSGRLDIRSDGTAPPGAPLRADPVQVVSLDGTWDLLLDPEGRGRDEGWHDSSHPAWADALAVEVPGPFELLPETAGYDGVVWYRTALPEGPDAGPLDGRVRLAFGGANDRAEVWLGGELLGSHDGSDIPFSFDVGTAAPPAGTPLVVRIVDPGRQPVDGLRLGARPHAKESWYVNYGGLTGSVSLRAAPMVELLRHDAVLPDGPGPESEPRLRLHLVNHGVAPREVDLVVQVHETERLHVASWGNPRRHTLPPGETLLDVPLPGDWPGRWSPGAPVLHRLRVEIVDGEREDRWDRPLALRHFAVEGSRFVLNGEPLYLKGVLFQPYWPRTLSHPPTPDFLRRELQAIKDAGFNLVRAHIRTMPALYELCDEIGLLVHAEPTLGWITHFDKTTRPAVDAAIEQLARDVAGHPSVVMVGLLNELSGELHRGRARLMEQAHALMPQMLLLEDSGSWTGTSHYWNPGADAPVPFDDLHVYRAWPWDEGDMRYVRSLGEDHDRLVFVSEYGYGGIARLFANVRGFGDELWLEDAQEHVRQLEEARAAMVSVPGLTPLGARGDNPHGMDADDLLHRLIDLGLQAQADAATFMTSALRSNPRVAGDVYTQWRDVMWEDGAGLVDVWGEPKPAQEAMTELNARDERPTDPVEALEPLAPFTRESWGKVPTERIGMLDAIAVDDAHRTVLEQMLVTDEATYQALIDAKRQDADDARVHWRWPRLAVVGRRGAWWSPDEIDTTVSLLRWVRDGGTALLLDPPDAGRPQEVDFFGYASYGAVADLPFEAHMRSARGHFVGKHLVLNRDLAAFLGLGVQDGPVTLGPRLSPVRVDRVLSVDGDPVSMGGREFDFVIPAAKVYDGYGLPVGGAVQTLFFGRGLIVLNTLPLDELDEDMLGRVLDALVLTAADATMWITGTAGLDITDFENPPPSRAPVTVPDEHRKRIGELVWQHKNYFGLAERLAYQDFNGSRPRRRDPEDLPAIMANKNAGLAAILDGDYEQGIALLERIEDGPLGGQREIFVRTEMRVAGKYRDWGGRPELPVRLRIGELHARALVAMRDGDLDRAMELLETAETVIENLPPWTGPRRGDRDGDGIPDEEDPDFVDGEGGAAAEDSTGQGLPGDR